MTGTYASVEVIAIPRLPRNPLNIADILKSL